MNWTSGYVAEIDYTYGYYRELSPTLLRLACLSAGITPPLSEKPSYLELGYGQGLSLNVHAAGNDGEFWGTDFNPNQAVQASSLASATRSGARLLNDSFAELAARTDLPDFDIIGLHGIWSWISDENRRVIVDIIRRKLRIGGIVYISYNCLPGWAPAMPLRHLMTLHADLAGSDAAGLVGKIDNAIEFAQKVINSGAFYFKINTSVAERLKRISGQNRNYLAHEFFNLDWDVMAFSDVARMLDVAKLNFAASAHMMDHVESINLAEPGRNLLAEIKNPVLRQSVRDYFVNQQFRRDIFIKGSHRLTPLDRTEAMRKQRFVLMNPSDDISMKVTGSLGEASLQEKVYKPAIEALADKSYSAKSLAELSADPKLASVPFPSLVELVTVLVGAGHLHPAQEPSRDVKTRCAALNRNICEQARGSGAISYLASPVTGSGIAVGRFQQLALLGLRQGKKTPKEQAAFIWSLLSMQGHRLLKDGKPVESADENLVELERQTTEFTEKRLPLLKALGVAD